MKLRRLVYFVLIIGIGVLLLANLGQFRSFLTTIKRANLLILATILFARYLYYWSNAKYFTSTFKIFGGSVSFKRALEASVVYNFLNTVIPSGGVSGTSYIAREFHDDVKASVATAVQLAWYIFTVMGYFFVLLLGFIALLLSNQISKVSFRVVIFVVVLVIVALIAIAAVASNYDLAKKIAWKFMTPINWLLKHLHKTPVERTQLYKFMEEFYDSFKIMLAAKSKLVKPLFYTFCGVTAEIISIYIVFLSLGHVVNPGIVVAGYSLAMLSSFSALFTSGVGVYEAVMSATFVALGQPFSTSFAVVIIYRFIAMWLFIPVGLYIYRHRNLA